MERKKIAIIGAGLAGLSSAALLSRDGFDVTVLDKLPEPGGVAGRYEEAGFLFDTGPSWYLMNGVYDRFFGFFGRKPSDYYELVRLDPSYRIFFEDGTRGVITRDPAANERFFDSLQEGGGEQLRKFLANSELKYRISVDKFLYREYRSFLPFLNPLLLAEGFRLNIFAKLDRFVSSYFTDVRARQVLEFNTVFLGSSPFQTPA
ncbi:MAG: NAD(P)-binding protein, partial [Spirochaetales bacterium]|nr:NAD(P)-binding protein [Spirochaetales bacterium]